MQDGSELTEYFFNRITSNPLGKRTYNPVRAFDLSRKKILELTRGWNTHILCQSYLTV